MSDEENYVPGTRRDLMELMMTAEDPETGKTLDDENIIDQSCSFFFAGMSDVRLTHVIVLSAVYFICS